MPKHQRSFLTKSGLKNRSKRYVYLFVSHYLQYTNLDFEWEKAEKLLGCVGIFLYLNTQMTPSLTKFGVDQ